MVVTDVTHGRRYTRFERYGRYRRYARYVRYSRFQAEPSVDELRAMMRRVFTHRDEARRRGAIAARDIAAKFDARHAARAIVRHLQRINASLGDLGDLGDSSAAATVVPLFAAEGALAPRESGVVCTAKRENGSASLRVYMWQVRA